MVSGMKHFNIDEAFLCSVNVSEAWSMYENVPKESLTESDLVKILQGKDQYTTTYTRDHPEFTALRDNLEQSGYIETRRNCWNADRVLQSFMLNEWLFETGERFPCATALKIKINVARHNNCNSLSL